MGIRELRDSLTATMRRVRNGETIEVTHAGVPIALITPVHAGSLERLLAAGEASAAKPLDGPLRRFPASGSLTASEALEDDRAGR